MPERLLPRLFGLRGQPLSHLRPFHQHRPGDAEAMTNDFDKEFTSIAVTRKTQARLKALGKKGESYEAILIKMLDAIEFWKGIPHE